MPHLFIAAYIVFALLALNLMLMVVAIGLRIRARRDIRHRSAAFAVWNRRVPAYLCGELNILTVQESVSVRDLPLFAGFIQPFLVDISGEDKARLLRLCDGVDLVAFLIAALRARSVYERGFAAHLLGLLGHAPAIPPLIAALEDRSELVRFAAAEALLQLHHLAALPVILGWLTGQGRSTGDRFFGLVMRFGPGVCPVLHELIRKPGLDDRVRVVAISGLAHYTHREATWDVLDTATHTANREVRLSALRALVKFEEPTLLPFFETLLGDKDPQVRSIAAKAVGQLGSEDAAAGLARLLRDADFWVLRAAVAALVGLGPVGLETLDVAEKGAATSDKARQLIAEARGARPGKKRVSRPPAVSRRSARAPAGAGARTR
jgi:HEAT repeat protein